MYNWVGRLKTEQELEEEIKLIASDACHVFIAGNELRFCTDSDLTAIQKDLIDKISLRKTVLESQSQ
jgi:hypothetical protein